MTRVIDKTGRIYISQKWLQSCMESTAIISVGSGSIIIQPYNPQKHNLDGLLYRRLDDHARIKIPPDIMKGIGFASGEQYHLYISPDNTALVRRMGDYSDVCGEETQTKMILGRNVCPRCLEYLKRSE